VLVRTPAAYGRAGARFPVLYLTDGEAHINHTAASVEFLARSGRMPELIIVGITNTDRTRDLTPTRSGFKRGDGKLAELPTSGGADNFLKFIETELIPQIEKQYRTQPYRLFAGHSFGGLFALHAMMARPDVFNAYIAVSPTFNWDGDLVVRRAGEFLKGRRDLDRALFVTLANEPGDVRRGYESFTALFGKTRPEGFSFASAVYEDEDHGSVVLRSHYSGLRHVFANWQLARDQAGLIPGGLPAVDDHYRQLSKRFRYEIVAPELLVNQLGYQLLGAGKADEAVAAFKANIERYPQSANVYDSLAEAYEKTGRVDLSAPLYEKAAKLGRENQDPNLAVYEANFARVSAQLKKSSAAGTR
jgi:predicted alpha/beta superfamily hydrolase